MSELDIEMETKDTSNTINIKKQRYMIFKVIFAMTLFLVGLPFLLFLATSYYTNKGLVMDVYLMAHEYTDKIDTFYAKNKSCPSEQSINVNITDADIANSVEFFHVPNTSVCNLTLTVRKLGKSMDNKTLTLSKDYSLANNTTWQCYSTINSLYLPSNCHQRDN